MKRKGRECILKNCILLYNAQHFPKALAHKLQASLHLRSAYYHISTLYLWFDSLSCPVISYQRQILFSEVPISIF